MESKKLHVQIQLTAADLWKFSMYHTNRGYLGIFNLLFTAAALYLTVTQWNQVTVPYRLLLLLCVLMFTVWQPGILYIKAAKQAKSPAVRDPMDLDFSEEGLRVEQGEQQAEFAWDQIGRVVRAPFLYVIYMDRVHAYLLPAGQIRGQEEAFRALVREKLPAVRRKGI